MQGGRGAGTRNAGLATSGLAITALIMGIFGMCIPLIGIAALIMGIVAINKIDNPANRLSGRGPALTGAILGGVGTVFSLLAIPVLFIAMLLPAIGSSRSVAQQMQSNTQLRGIHQGMSIYAQHNQVGTSAGRFPGLNADGSVNDVSVAFRYHELLDKNLFGSEYAIAPTDNKTAWISGPVTTDNYSYSMLDVSDPGARQNEWSETLSSEALVMSDRNTGNDAQQQVSSIWTTPNSGQWEGGVVYNDNHAQFQTGHLAETRYGNMTRSADNIFKMTGPDDAAVIYQGE